MIDFDKTSSNLYTLMLQRESDICGTSGAQFGNRLFRERLRMAKNLYSTDLRAHYGCVNAIEFSSTGQFLASGGDDKRVLLWDIEMTIAAAQKPRQLNTEHTSNIFCLGFDRKSSTIYSGGNDDVVIAHDFETGKLANVFKHNNPVYGLSVDPQSDSIIATACEDGQILVFDQRVDPADPFVVAQLRASFHAVQFHPVGGNFLVTANSKHGSAFWDIRKPHHPIIQYGYEEDPPSCMSVRFNSTGNLVLALRRRLPPILYNTHSPEPVCTLYHGNYYNSCTMKSCAFAGQDDELVLSGSDDFNLYVWRLTDIDLECTDQWIETTQMILYGHRSIVNQVRYNRQKCLFASSGVEKLIKLWSPFSQKGWTGSLLEESSSAENPRELFSPFNFASMSTPPHTWSHMSHDYSSRNTNEDPRMMAFFDSLIQQEIEGWETNSSTESPTDSDDDDDEDDDDTDEHFGTGTKRQLVRKKERKHRNLTLRKLKVQRHKFINRIAYLIATKRNTLRRLAIRGATVRNQRQSKITKRVRHTKNVCKTTSTRNTNLQSHTSILSTSEIAVASTSAAAGTIQPGIFRSQRRKYRKKRNYDTSSDEEHNEGLKVPHKTTVLNNGPSTSTGITKSPKDNIHHLRQQHSDSDDDDSPITIQHSSGTIVNSRPTTMLPQPGFIDIADNSNFSNAEMAGSRLLNSYQDDVLDSTSSSSSDNVPCHALPLKRRKIIEHNAITELEDNVERSKIKALPSSNTNLNEVINSMSKAQKTPIKADEQAYHHNDQLPEIHIYNRNNLLQQDQGTSLLLLTPDSGISVGTATPAASDHQISSMSPLHQQKLSRVRRNFDDDSDSN